MQSYPWRIQIVCSLPVLAMALILWGVFGSEVDTARHFADSRHLYPILTATLKIITDIGNYVIYLIYVAFLVVGFRNRDTEKLHLAVCFVIAFTITVIAVYFLKGYVGRSRPYLEPGFSRWSWNFDQHSFPSGHTTEAVLSVVPAAMFFRKYPTALALGLVAACIAFTRVYLSVHYLSDIMGGLIMGNIGATLTWLLFSHLRRKSAES